MGRKSLYQENYKEIVVKMAWVRAKRILASTKSTDEAKNEIMKAIISRTAPQELKGSGKGRRLIIINQPKLTQGNEPEKVIEITSS